jgi:ankyrin repeat protein
MDEQLLNAVNNNNYDEVCDLLDTNTQFTNLDQCLIIASMKNYITIVEKLLQKGANANVKHNHRNSLFQACMKGHVEIVKLILKYNMNVPPDYDKILFFRLITACQYDKMEVVKVFIEHGVKLKTSLLYFAKSNEMINLLFSYGVIFDKGLDEHQYHPVRVEKDQLLQKLWDVYNTPDGKCANKKK